MEGLAAGEGMWQRTLALALVPALHARNELDAFPARLHNDKSL